MEFWPAKAASEEAPEASAPAEVNDSQNGYHKTAGDDTRDEVKNPAAIIFRAIMKNGCLRYGEVW